MFITFSYKVGNNPIIFCGKYVFEHISDDHEGLDLEVEHILRNGLNKYRELRGIKPLHCEIHVAVISFSGNKHIQTYSSIKETKCFDFYALYENYHIDYYVNGKRLEKD